METVIGKTVKAIIDRPLGSRHSRHSDMIYSRYVEGVMAGDGEEQDAYVLGACGPDRDLHGQGDRRVSPAA